jgi:hypothetical protein
MKFFNEHSISYPARLPGGRVGKAYKKILYLLFLFCALVPGLVIANESKRPNSFIIEKAQPII